MFLNNVGGFYGNNPMWGQTVFGNQVPNVYGWNQIPFQFYGNNVPFTGPTMLNGPFGTQQFNGLHYGVVPTLNNGMVPNYNTGMVPNYNTGMLPNYNTGMVPNYNTGIVPNCNTGIVPHYNTAPYTNPFMGHTGLQTQTIGRGMPFVGPIGNPLTGC